MEVLTKNNNLAYVADSSKSAKNSIIKFNLQQFGEKTEEATPKKRRDARKKGQVVQSKDLTSSIQIFLVFTSIHMFKGLVFDQTKKFYLTIMNIAEQQDTYFTLPGVSRILGEMFITILICSLPFLLVALISGVLLNYFQVGFLFTTETLKFKLDKINPISGFKKLFSLRSLVELAKSVLKASLVLFLAFSYINGKKELLLEIVNYPLMQMLTILWNMVYNVIVRCCLVLVVLGIFDYYYKIWQNNKDLKMTKQEIKDEYKQSEGDPQLKAKIKEKQRMMAMGRMMQEVPKADVIITNPTHYAVAVKYDASLSPAPMVVAKGQDLIAQNIKKIGQENDVQIVENKPLARLLYAEVEIGSPIPPQLYEAVAEVLAYVYSLKK